MLTFWLPFILWSTTGQLDATTSSQAVVLYQQAAKALRSDQRDKAAEALEQLVREHAQSPLAALAAVRLAELRLSSGQHQSGLELLIEWSTQVLKAAETLEKLDPGVAQRSEKLLISALAKMPNENIEWLEQWVEKQNPAKSPGSSQPAAVFAIRELSGRYMADQQFDKSLRWLELLGDTATDQELELRDFQVPLRLLRQKPSRQWVDEFSQRLESHPTGSLIQQAVLRLAMADAYRQWGEVELAKKQLQQVTDQLNAATKRPKPTITAEGQKEPIRTIADLQATACLRTAELFVHESNFRGAAELLANGLKIYSDYPALHEFRFLLARCAIADIEFQVAKEQMQQVVEQSQPGSEHRSRALWTLGEIELLQRNYQQAYQYYRQVIESSGQPQWQARALLQQAKCCEMLGQGGEAMAAYRRILDEFAQSDVVDQANHRLTLLQAAQPKSSTATKQNQSPVTSEVR